MKILLVDDEIVALNALKKRVDWLQYGFSEVLTAQDAATARELLEKNAIDLILCDIEMPGEDGLSLVEYIRGSYPDTACIMVTCHADFSYIKRSMKSQVIDYVLKPIDYEELNGLLAQFAAEKKKMAARQGIARIVERVQEQREDPADSRKNRISCVKSYIEDHIREKIYVEDLAALIHVNDQYLMRIFKRETGKSLTEYITERRIHLAGNLLKDSNYTINFIADCVGCENYSYFTKLFKKYTGFTPREYRNQFGKR